MLEHRRGLEPKPERAERAGFRHATQTYQPTLRENSRVAHATGKSACLNGEHTMTNKASKIDPEDWKYAQQPSTWRSWGAVGLGLFIIAIGVFAALVHIAGLI
jgi:hypothetical protein